MAPWRLSALYALLMGALAVGAPGWTGGDARAALLPGTPGIIVALLFALGRAPSRRRACMALTTATAGAVALATVGSLGALGAEGGASPATLFQASVFGLSALMVAVTGPAWRRVNALGDEADRLLRMYDEL